MVLGKNPFVSPPRWKIGDSDIMCEDSVEILGVTIENNLNYSSHVQKRTTVCRQRMYGLTSVGMSYPGLASETKAYLWNSIGAPMITYGMDSVNLTNANLKQLRSVQGNVIKRVMGIPKRSHHSELLEALRIPATDELVKVNTQKSFTTMPKLCKRARSPEPQFITDLVI